jgi:hypothetical protein
MPRGSIRPSTRPACRRGGISIYKLAEDAVLKDGRRSGTFSALKEKNIVSPRFDVTGSFRC